MLLRRVYVRDRVFTVQIHNSPLLSVGYLLEMVDRERLLIHKCLQRLGDSAESRLSNSG